MTATQPTRREIVLREARRWFLKNGGVEGFHEAIDWASETAAELADAREFSDPSLRWALDLWASAEGEYLSLAMAYGAAFDQAIAAAGLAAIVDREDAAAAGAHTRRVAA